MNDQIFVNSEEDSEKPDSNESESIVKHNIKVLGC
jgi:hypothetical protein